VGLVLDRFSYAFVLDVVVVAKFTESIPQHSKLLSEQIEEPQSAHFVTAGLPQGVPLSLSLDTYSSGSSLGTFQLTRKFTTVPAGTGSLWRSLSNSFSRPTLCE